MFLLTIMSKLKWLWLIWVMIKRVLPCAVDGIYQSIVSLHWIYRSGKSRVFKCHFYTVIAAWRPRGAIVILKALRCLFFKFIHEIKSQLWNCFVWHDEIHIIGHIAAHYNTQITYNKLSGSLLNQIWSTFINN